MALVTPMAHSAGVPSDSSLLGITCPVLRSVCLVFGGPGGANGPDRTDGPCGAGAPGGAGFWQLLTTCGSF